LHTKVTIKHRSTVLALSSAAAMTCLSIALGAVPAAMAQPDKNIVVRASIEAAAATPATHECKKRNGVEGVPYTNPATLGTAPGDTWHSVGPVTDTTCVYQTTEGVIYTGTESGTVTIDGCGTGFVVLEFEGSLSPDFSSERSTARLQPGKGTGDLKGASGTVVSESTLNPDGSATGVLTGTVHCPMAR
jgi:hypothetical protein